MRRGAVSTSKAIFLIVMFAVLAVAALILELAFPWR